MYTFRGIKFDLDGLVTFDGGSMIADNGVYIAEFPDGYRIAYGQAIDNIEYYPAGSSDWEKMLQFYFGKSKVYLSKDEAILAAHKLHETYAWTEYGVSFIGFYNVLLT